MIVVANNESKIGSSLIPALFSAFQHQAAIPTNGLSRISVEPLTPHEQQVQPNDVTPSNVEFVSKCSCNKIIASKDHTAVQLDIAEHTGRMTGKTRTYALCGSFRLMGGADDSIVRLATRDGFVGKGYYLKETKQIIPSFA
ncbi:unnamed protein product [Adineta steineri]|uniref:40S ribosomal protein S21 n=1 Tax=Adineta steineri TaxID=433720 RepID=A0A814I2S0_9BILA|nr:unnamed protein product [Adineta steineri]CAF4101813.1 unnamed protein product [Adineta steineri]